MAEESISRYTCDWCGTSEDKKRERVAASEEYHLPDGWGWLKGRTLKLELRNSEHLCPKCWREIVSLRERLALAL
jgi:hypothetical protein